MPSKIRFRRCRYWFGTAWEVGWRWPNGVRYDGTNATLPAAFVQAGRALRRGMWG